MNYEQIDNKTTQIIYNLQVISNNINLLKTKIMTINNINSKLGKKMTEACSG